MKLSIQVRRKDALLDLTRTGQACRFQIGSDPERHAEVAQPEPGVYSVLMAGRSYEARVEPGADGEVVVVIDGHRFDIEVRDPRQFRRRNGFHGIDGLENVTAPIPGKVVRLLVPLGATVTSGQPLMVIEAMKMQNEMRAPKTGRVVSIPVHEGDTVAAGAVLATIE
ncbi:MAG TPA: acetyl-CoA carboxylase biotin carboxyl carrier protein subunit [Bryobacteraceae bacterium]|nr:acetyl-CoA carboxylase biotin carboxyl carrier protein subunit [Bryobacteraceae bacterium]